MFQKFHLYSFIFRPYRILKKKTMSRTIITSAGIIFDTGNQGPEGSISGVSAQISCHEHDTITFLPSKGTGTCNLTGVGTPLSATHATNKEYVDVEIASNTDAVRGLIDGVGAQVSSTKEMLNFIARDVTIFGDNLNSIAQDVMALDAITDNISESLTTFSDGTGVANIESMTCGSINCTDDLVVDGHVTATSMTSTSDVRLKRNVVGLSRDRAVHILRQLRPVTYIWKKTNTYDIGFIAQDVNDIVPEFVHTDEDGTMSIDYGKITAILVAAWQHNDID
jgi:hypothetical protein